MAIRPLPLLIPSHLTSPTMATTQFRSASKPNDAEDKKKDPTLDENGNKLNDNEVDPSVNDVKVVTPKVVDNRPIDNSDPMAAEPTFPKDKAVLNAKADEEARIAQNKRDSIEASDEQESSQNVVDHSDAWSLIEDKKFSLSPKAKRVRDHLAAQDLVKMMMPRADGESKGSTQYFNLSGFAFHLPKGEYVNVPEDVAQMIMDTFGQDQRLVDDHPKNLKNNSEAAKEFKR